MRRTIICFLLLAVGTPVFCAQAGSRPATNSATQSAKPPASDEEQRNEAGVLAGRIPNARLVDQDGRRICLRDLLDNNVVVINFVYTSCTAYCGMQGANFARLQKLLSSRGATGVVLVSITTDPKNDTPLRLKEWAQKVGWKPGWLLLTGSLEELEPVLVALTGDRGGSGVHSTVALIANPSRGVWIRADALDAPHRLAAMIDQVRTSKDPGPVKGRWKETSPVRKDVGSLDRFP